jgi:hypothetical protein
LFFFSLHAWTDVYSCLWLQEDLRKIHSWHFFIFLNLWVPLPDPASFSAVTFLHDLGPRRLTSLCGPPPLGFLFSIVLPLSFDIPLISAMFSFPPFLSFLDLIYSCTNTFRFALSYFFVCDNYIMLHTEWFLAFSPLYFLRSGWSVCKSSFYYPYLPNMCSFMRYPSLVRSVFYGFVNRLRIL